ncbi:MAG: hypothetical protein HYX78_08125 [Armatimonadetes bacterium]|nr:hypothetical protein [Armatimonadota bacterium]
MTDSRIAYIGAACAGYFALWLVAPELKFLGCPAAMLVLTALFMFVQISLVRWFASLSIGPLHAVIILIVAALLWLTVVLIVSSPYLRYEAQGLPPVPMRFRTAPPASVELPLPQTEQKEKQETKKITLVRKPETLNFRMYAFNMAAGRWRAASSFLIIAAASAFGYLLSYILRHPNILMPVAAFVPFIDLWTVLVGPTSKAIEKAPHIVHTVSAAMPAPGGAVSGYQPISFVGPADFIFLAMFFAAIYRFRMNPSRTFWILFPALTVGMAAVLAGLFPPGLPALVLIGLCVIIANFRHFELKKDEYVAIGIVAALLIAAIAAITIFSAK